MIVGGCAYASLTRRNHPFVAGVMLALATVLACMAIAVAPLEASDPDCCDFSAAAIAESSPLAPLDLAPLAHCSELVPVTMSAVSARPPSRPPAPAPLVPTDRSGVPPAACPGGVCRAPAPQYQARHKRKFRGPAKPKHSR